MSGVNFPALLSLVITLAVVFAPLVFVRKAPPGQSEDGSDDGPGGQRRPPDDPPGSPPGGAPLGDAQPARVRLRGHERLADLLPGAARRRSREPERAPATTPH